VERSLSHGVRTSTSVECDEFKSRIHKLRNFYNVVHVSLLFLYECDIIDLRTSYV
jgi:hypothetical protein